MFQLLFYTLTILNNLKLYHLEKERMEKILYLRGREREFNRTFVSLFDGDSRNDQKQRRENQWKDYLRKNPNNEQIEPIDYFFPISTNLKNGLINNQTINKKKGYCRLLIKNKNENNTNKSIS